MISYIETTCPGCSRHIRVREAYVGRSIVCNHCDHPFVAEVSNGNGHASTESQGPEGARRREPETARERVAALELEVERLRTAINGRDREVEHEAELSRRAHDQAAKASASVRVLEDQLEALHRRREADRRFLREVGACLAHLDRSRSEMRDASARLEAVEFESGRRAASAIEISAERDRLGLACRELGRELERRGADRAQWKAELSDVISSRDSARRELDEARGRWNAERVGLQGEVGRLIDGLDRALAGRDEARALLGSERVDHGRQVEAFRSEALRLREDVDARRVEGDAARAEGAALIRERGRLEALLRGAVADSEDARSRHDAATRQLSEELRESRRLHQEALDRLDVTSRELASTREESSRAARARQVEAREHHIALAGLRSGRESERKAYVDLIGRERSSHGEEVSRRLAEIEVLRGEADRLRGDGLALRDALEGHRRELERRREEAEVLSDEHAGLLERHEEACRELGEWQSRCLVAEGLALSEGCSAEIFPDGREGREGHSRGPRSGGTTEEVRHACSRTTCERADASVPRANGLENGASFEGHLSKEPGRLDLGRGTEIALRRVSSLVPHDAAGRERSEEEPWALWRLPEAADLSEARQQIALLSDLLRTAQQANARFSERLSSVKHAEPGAREAESTPRSEPPDVRSVARKERDEAAWHLGLATRAARLAERRRTGRP